MTSCETPPAKTQPNDTKNPQLSATGSCSARSSLAAVVQHTMRAQRKQVKCKLLLMHGHYSMINKINVLYPKITQDMTLHS